MSFSLGFALVCARLQPSPLLTDCRVVFADGTLGKSYRLPREEIVKRLARGSAMMVDTLDPVGQANFAHGFAWPSAETAAADEDERDDELYEVFAVYRHRGEGADLEFLVCYTHSPKRTWQPLSDFLEDDVCNSKVLKYLRRHDLAEPLGLE